MPLLTVQVPAGVEPGQQFLVDHAGQQVMVTVPPGVSAGQQIQVQAPDPPMAAAPVLNPPGHWKYMISYKQSEAKEEAVKLAYELTGNKDDVWLDINKEDKSVAAMKEAVRESETFLCILTPSYFKSEYCLNELKWAREFEKTIVSCYPQDENVGEILSTAPEEVAFISSIDSKKVDMSDPRFFAVSLEMIRGASKGTGSSTASTDQLNKGWRAVIIVLSLIAVSLLTASVISVICKRRRARPLPVEVVGVQISAPSAGAYDMRPNTAVQQGKEAV